MPPVRVLVADDSEVIRKAIRGFLKNEATVQVCGESINFEQTIELAASLKPDVILLDLHMPDGNDFEPAFVKSNLLSTSRVLAMSLPMKGEDMDILASGYGAAALLDKARLVDDLIPAIQRCMASRK